MASRKGTSGKRQARAQRVRYGPLPRPSERVEVPYARDREGLKGLSCGELTEIVAQTQAFKDEIGEICLRLDAASGARGPKRAYTALECELVLLYQRACGLKSYKEARDRLTSDRAVDARRLFGLNRPREINGSRRRTLRDGVPSEATISRHKKRFGERRRRGAYERLARRLVREHLIEFPEMREEARITGIDGSKIETHYTAPKYDKKGRLVNAKKVTCEDGGFVPWSAGAEKSGSGYNLVTVATMSGLPLVWGVDKLNAPENEIGRELLEREYARDVRPHLNHDKLHLLLADSAYRSQSLRQAARELGVIEQIHSVSHSKNERSEKNAERYNQIRYKIQGYPNWEANAHGELACKCGQGQVAKAVSVNDGRAVVRSEGRCTKCGSISITSGRWRRAKNPTQFVRCEPDVRDRADWSFGNPLTFNDPLAQIYGKKRYAHGEGMHGQLSTRFQLLKGKRWFRRVDQAKTDTAVVFSIIHALAIEQRRRAASTRGLPARGAPLAQAA